MPAEITRSFALQERQRRDERDGLRITKSIITGLQAPSPGQLPSIDRADRGIFDSAAEVSALDTMRAAASRVGLISEEGVESIKGIIKDFGPQTEYDADMNIVDILNEEGNEVRKEFMNRVFAGTSESDERLKAAIIASPNRDDFLDLVDTHIDNKARQEAASASGAAIELLGSFIGASRDALISIPIGGAGLAGVKATGLVARGLLEMGVVSTAEASVAAAERLIRAQRDLIINGNEEALESAAIAFGLTFALSGGVVAISRRKEIMKLIATRGNIEHPGSPQGAGGGTVGAAASPHVDATTLTTSPGSLVARIIPQAFRTLKGVVTDKFATATEVFLKTGDRALLKSAQVLDNLIGPNVDRVNAHGTPVAKKPGLEDAVLSGREEGAAWDVVIRTGHNKFHQDAFGGKKSAVTRDEYDRLVSRIIQMKSQDITDPDMILGRFAKELEPGQQKKLLSSLEETSGIIKERTLSNGQRAEKAGMLQEGQVVENYMPITPRRGGGADEEMYFDYFLDMMHRASDENVNDILPGRLEEGETFAKIRQDDPARARQIMDDLDAANIQARGEKSYVKELEAEKALQETLGKTKASLKAKWQKRLDTLEKPKRKIKLTEEQAVKRTAEIETLKTRLNEIDNVELAGLRDMIKKHGSAGQKKAIKALSAAHTRALRASKKASTGTPRAEAARKIARDIMEGRIAGNIVPDRLTSNAGFTKDRVIDHDFADPRFEQLFETRASVALRVHSAQFQPRLYLHENFGQLKKAGEDVSNVPSRLISEAGENADAATKAKIRDDQSVAEAAIKAALNLDRIPGSKRARAFDFWSQQVAKFNIASMLKMLGITQITDFALVLGRGRTPMTGVTGVFNAKQTLALARAARAEGQIDLTVALEGIETMGLRNPMDDFRNATADRRVLDQYGLDAEEIGARSELERSVEKTLDVVGNIAGWLSFASPMNLVLRRAMGADTAKMVISDMVNFRALKPDIQRRWLNHGIDEQAADDIAAFINGPKGTITLEGVQFPNYRLLRTIDHSLLTSPRAASTGWRGKSSRW